MDCVQSMFSNAIANARESPYLVPTVLGAVSAFLGCIYCLYKRVPIRIAAEPNTDPHTLKTTARVVRVVRGACWCVGSARGRRTPTCTRCTSTPLATSTPAARLLSKTSTAVRLDSANVPAALLKKRLVVLNVVGPLATT
jgi:hypothetical protein